MLYYLTGYLFTVPRRLHGVCIAMREMEGEDISAIAGCIGARPCWPRVWPWP